MSETLPSTLVLAALFNDCVANEEGFEAVARSAGLDLSDLLHMVQQRALRAVLYEIGGHDALRELGERGERVVIQLDDAQQSLCDLLELAYADGILIGARAAQFDLPDDFA